jgi:hypothetical protein
MGTISINAFAQKGIVLLFAVCLLIFSIPVFGQYDLSWYTIDGGGGRSVSGKYCVSGTIGQPDAASSSGGNYELFGGFWPWGPPNIPGLELTKTDDVDDGDCVGSGDYITYTINYNYPAGPNLPDINDVNIIDYLPEEVEPDNLSDPNYNPDDHTYIWNIGTLHPGDSNSVTLIVEVKCPVPGGEIRNKCKLKSGALVLRIAYETTSVCLCGCPIYVDADASSCNNNGYSWKAAFTNLQDALEMTQTCDCNEIWVAQGIYKPNGSGDRNATFSLINSVAIYGGFPPGGGVWEDRNPDVYETILSGDIGNIGDSSDNSYHVVTADNVDETAILDGFTITAGNSIGSGGGMYNISSNPIVTKCIFSENEANVNGG